MEGKASQCFKCRKAITQVPYKYEGMTFHARCLQCSTCEKKLVGKPFIVANCGIFCGEQCKFNFIEHPPVNSPPASETRDGAVSPDLITDIEALQSVAQVTQRRSNSPLPPLERVTDYPVAHSLTNLRLSQSPNTHHRPSSISPVPESHYSSNSTLNRSDSLSAISETSGTSDTSKQPAQKRILKKTNGPRRISTNHVRWNLDGVEHPSEEGDSTSMDSVEAGGPGDLYRQAKEKYQRSRSTWKDFEAPPLAGSTGLTPAPPRVQQKASFPPNGLPLSPIHKASPVRFPGYYELSPQTLTASHSTPLRTGKEPYGGEGVNSGDASEIMAAGFPVLKINDSSLASLEVTAAEDGRGVHMFEFPQETPRPQAPPTAMGTGVTGPGVTGPGVTGPGVTGPGVTGPGVTGPGVMGPVSNNRVPMTLLDDDDASDYDHLAEKAPSDPLRVPSDTQRAPSNTQKAPNDTRRAPNGTQRAPNDTLRAPSDTQRAPSDLQKVPNDTQRAPNDTQRVPSDTQRAPSDLQKVPNDTQRVPSDTQRAPSDTQRAPSGPLRAPSDTQRAPSGPLRAPSDTQRVPNDTQRALSGPLRALSDTQRVPSDTQRVPSDTQRALSGPLRAPSDTQRAPSVIGLPATMIAMTPTSAMTAGGPGGPLTSGPGGPLASGPGGPLASGPGGPLASGPGGPLASGPGGPLASGPGGPLASGPGGPLASGPGGPLASGPGGPLASGPGGPLTVVQHSTVRTSQPERSNDLAKYTKWDIEEAIQVLEQEMNALERITNFTTTTPLATPTPPLVTPTPPLATPTPPLVTPTPPLATPTPPLVTPTSPPAPPPAPVGQVVHNGNQIWPGTFPESQSTDMATLHSPPQAIHPSPWLVTQPSPSPPPLPSPSHLPETHPSPLSLTQPSPSPPPLPVKNRRISRSDRDMEGNLVSNVAGMQSKDLKEVELTHDSKHLPPVIEISSLTPPEGDHGELILPPPSQFLDIPPKLKDDDSDDYFDLLEPNTCKALPQEALSPVKTGLRDPPTALPLGLASTEEEWSRDANSRGSPLHKGGPLKMGPSLTHHEPHPVQRVQSSRLPSTSTKVSEQEAQGSTLGPGRERLTTTRALHISDSESSLNDAHRMAKERRSGVPMQAPLHIKPPPSQAGANQRLVSSQVERPSQGDRHLRRTCSQAPVPLLSDKFNPTRHQVQSTVGIDGMVTDLEMECKKNLQEAWPTCAVCGKLIVNSPVHHEKSSYHSKCFHCVQCGCSLVDKTVYRTRMGLCCKEHQASIPSTTPSQTRRTDHQSGYPGHSHYHHSLPGGSVTSV